MIGRLFNTLRYRLNQDMRDWRKSNQLLREYAWPWYQNLLITAGARPIRSPFLLFESVLIVSIVIWVYYFFKAYQIGMLELSPTKTDQYFFALWTVQAAISAMIYPIVIGFVTLLLQRRHSAKASLHIYLHDSAAILTGLSSLFLVITMGVQFLFLTTVIQDVVQGWMVINTLWFIVNIMGVIWFLVRTFDYLRPERRTNIMRTYAINHIWPREVQQNLEYNLFMGAVHYGWLPGPIYGDDKSDSNTAVFLGPVGRNMGEIHVTAKRKGGWLLSDVRFRTLALAVRSWQLREEKFILSSGGARDGILGMRNASLFILPCIPGESFKPDIGLCRTEGGRDLHWWVWLLIRWSFVLTPAGKTTTTLSISDLMNGLITEVLIAMEAGEEVAFREVLHDLVDLHADLILAGDFVTDNGQRDNYANLVDRSDAFEARMHDLWVREYRRLLDVSIARLTESDTYFNHMIHVSGWLISRLGATRPVSISVYILNLSRSLHYRLNLWWSKTGEEQGAIAHGICSPVMLKPPAFSIYESAIKKFVGAWESLRNYYFPPKRDELLSWKEYGEYTELYTTHLEDTIYMLFDSLLLGNKEGAEWMCDTIIKWWNTSRFELDNTHFYIRDDRGLTLELINKPWDGAREVIDLSVAGNDEESAPKALWAACIHNYWIDLFCMTLYAMIQFGKDCDCEQSISADLVASLAQGKALRAGGSGYSQWPIRNVEDLIIIILRQFYFDGGYHRGYRARLNKVAEGISNQGKPAMVPGRIYSGRGLDDLDSLRDGQLVLLCLFVKKDWVPSARLMDIIQKFGVQDDDGLRAFVEQLKQWKVRMSEADFYDYDKLLSCIHAKSNADNESLQNVISSFDSGIDQMITGIEDFRHVQLRDAHISERRLTEVAKWCSQSGFNKESADVPVTLFSVVQYSAEEYDEHSLIINEMNKGEFVEPEMAQRAGNEDEWFDQTISSHVAGSVMADVLKVLESKVVDVDSAVNYWKQIKNAASKIRNSGGTPILLVASQSEPHWLLEWNRSRYDERVERPEDLRFTHDKKITDEGYLGSLNDIPIFISPILPGSSYLLSREIFNELSFSDLGDGVYVQVTYEPVKAKDELINLKLSWRFRLSLNKKACWRLRYVHNQKMK